MASVTANAQFWDGLTMDEVRTFTERAGLQR